MLYFIKVFLLSLVQGVTEFFPVSSSGHLVLIQSIIDFHNSVMAYDIVLHMGTLLAVIYFFRKDIITLLAGLKEKENLSFLIQIALATIPAVIVGLFFKKQIEEMFSSVYIVSWALIFTSIVLLLSSKLRFNIGSVYVASVIIGVGQAIAIIPGISRSGMTISLALILCLSHEKAFRFSFIMSIPVILGATILSIPDIKIIYQMEAFYVLVAFFLSAIFGFIALTLLKRIVLRKMFYKFAYYCFFLGVIVMIWAVQ